MRNESHKTLVGTLRQHVVAWRKREGWSRETVVQEIVDAHARIDGPAATGIVFDPTTRDPFERQKVNADRVFRWLDDESKDNNQVPPNFILSILIAMPPDARRHCLDELLQPLGMRVTSDEQHPDGEFDASHHLSDMIRESSEAQLALVKLGPGAGLGALETALKEVSDVHASSSRTRRALAAAIAKMKAGAAIMRRFTRSRATAAEST